MGIENVAMAEGQVIEKVEERKREEPVEEEVECVIIPGPELKIAVNEKKLKNITKAGGKRGVEIEGAADMGGLQFFCTQVDQPLGDLDMLIESVKAMNQKSDPSEEERKGGAGKIGKIVLSSTEKTLALVAYVPKDKADQCGAKEWLQQVVKDAIGDKAKQEKACKETEFEGIDSKYWYAAKIDTIPDENVFTLKIRDACISLAYGFLRKRQLFPEDNDDDDEEMCFGDEDFP